MLFRSKKLTVRAHKFSGTAAEKIAKAGGSTEVGDVSWNTPTMGAMFSAWPQNVAPHQWGCTACHGMSIGQKAVVQAAHAMAAMGLDLMTEPDLLKAATEEFNKRLNGKSYKSINEAKSPLGGKMDLEHRHHFDCVIHATMEHFGIEEAVS